MKAVVVGAGAVGGTVGGRLHDAGRDVVLDFHNAGSVFHDWHVAGLPNVEAGARPGQTEQIRFRVDQPGTYAYDCTVTGHAASGMTGVLIVQQPGGTS